MPATGPTTAPAPASAPPAPGAMAARGVCPSVRRPMTAGDGLLARVRLAGGSLTPDQARALAATAARHGNGVVELTSRANVQVRGVRPEALDALVADLTDAGLLSAVPEGEASADVVVPPASGADPTERLDVRPLADALRARLRAGATGPLHPKAGVVLDGGGTLSVRGLAADVSLGATVDTVTGEVVLEVVLGHPLAHAQESATALVVTPEAAPDLVTRLLTLAARGTAAVLGPTRVRDLVATHGRDETLHLAGFAVTPTTPVHDTHPVPARTVEDRPPGSGPPPTTAPGAGTPAPGLDDDERAVSVRTVGRRWLWPEPGPSGIGDAEAPTGGLADDRRVMSVQIVERLRLRAAGATAADGDHRTLLGVRATRRGRAMVGALPALGRLDAGALRGLADAVVRHGGTELRLTPGRGVLVPDVDIDDARSLVATLTQLGFITAAGDPAAGVIACAGRPGCPSAHADTQSDGLWVAANLGGALPGAARPTVHLSGCAKRCASRGARDVTLIAEPGGAYAVLVGDDEHVAGRAHGVEDAMALAAAAAAPAATTTITGRTAAQPTNTGAPR
ncbi:MAG TPA: precorrin-3B synthase [Acidimicrobiales bacterium]|nr:precorrin-3B synthase [Acidimicrobiales bacterium]